jgi:hypothetical protein
MDGFDYAMYFVVFLFVIILWMLKKKEEHKEWCIPMIFAISLGFIPLIADLLRSGFHQSVTKIRCDAYNYYPDIPTIDFILLKINKFMWSWFK